MYCIIFTISLLFILLLFFFTQPLVAGFELHKLRMQIQMVWISKVQACIHPEEMSQKSFRKRIVSHASSSGKSHAIENKVPRSVEKPIRLFASPLIGCFLLCSLSTQRDLAPQKALRTGTVA